MRFKRFVLKNFRGVKHTTLDLGTSPASNINVLVGLNESGKTTVLDGIYHFMSNPNLLATAPSETQRTASTYQAMLPIGKCRTCAFLSVS